MKKLMFCLAALAALSACTVEVIYPPKPEPVYDNVLMGHDWVYQKFDTIDNIELCTITWTATFLSDTTGKYVTEFKTDYEHNKHSQNLKYNFDGINGETFLYDEGWSGSRTHGYFVYDSIRQCITWKIDNGLFEYDFYRK